MGGLPLKIWQVLSHNETYNQIVHVHSAILLRMKGSWCNRLPKASEFTPAASTSDWCAGSCVEDPRFDWSLGTQQTALFQQFLPKNWGKHHFQHVFFSTLLGVLFFLFLNPGTQRPPFCYWLGMPVRQVSLRLWSRSRQCQSRSHRLKGWSKVAV